MRFTWIAAAALAVLAPATAHAGADLTFDSIEAVYNPVNPAVEFTLTVKNIGDAAVQPSYFVDLIAIQDGDWASCGPDFWAFEEVHDDLMPGATRDIELSIHPDHLLTGEVYFFVDIEDDVGEEDEDNNAGVALVVNDGMSEVFIRELAFNNNACLRGLVQTSVGVILPVVGDKIFSVLPVIPFP